MPLTITREFSVACRIGREPVQVSRARERAREALAGWGLGEHADLAEILVSELATNAQCHGDGPIEMRLSYGGGELRVEVHDHGAGRPVRKHAGSDDEGGRGLEVLDGLIEWRGGERGVLSDYAGHGKTVWVLLSLEASPARAR